MAKRFRRFVKTHRRQPNLCTTCQAAEYSGDECPSEECELASWKRTVTTKMRLSAAIQQKIRYYLRIDDDEDAWTFLPSCRECAYCRSHGKLIVCVSCGGTSERIVKTLPYDVVYSTTHRSLSRTDFIVDNLKHFTGDEQGDFAITIYRWMERRWDDGLVLRICNNGQSMTGDVPLTPTTTISAKIYCFDKTCCLQMSEIVEASADAIALLRQTRVLCPAAPPQMPPHHT